MKEGMGWGWGWNPAKVSKINTFSTLKIKSKAYSSLQFANRKGYLCYIQKKKKKPS